MDQAKQERLGERIRCVVEVYAADCSENLFTMIARVVGEEEIIPGPDNMRLIASAVAPYFSNIRDKVKIWSFEHNQWWRPYSRGYTELEGEAGLYDRDEAEIIVRNANITGKIEEQIVEIGEPRPSAPSETPPPLDK